MEPQIINYYNHKNVLCKICSRKGHTSGSCPNVGMAKIGTKEKKEDKVDGLVFNVTSFSPQKKRGMEPQKKESKGGEINYPTDDFLMNDKPKKKRGRKPKKDKDDDPISSIIFTDSDDEFIIDEDNKQFIVKDKNTIDYTETLKGEVYRIYKKDFELLGYDKNSYCIKEYEKRIEKVTTREKGAK